MTPRAVVVLGVCQCVNWGVLYYAFTMLVLPLERELAVPAWIVTGAFSLALLISALLAPTIGRWSAHGSGPLVMQAGGIMGPALLTAWTFMPGVPSLYLVWIGLGICMAATLYEPAFVIVGRAYADPARRLRALAAVTLFGGLASTVFLPATALLVSALEWRGAVIVLAALMVVSTVMTRMFVFRELQGLATPGEHTAPHGRDVSHGAWRFLIVAASFALASLASAGFSANLVPALGERGASPSTAAMLGGLMGLMQLPGRALLMNGTLAGSPAHLAAASLLLLAGGLGAVALASTTPLAAAGTMTFALGAGMTTLARPHLIQTMFGDEASGRLNGRVARNQQLARAAGPLAVAWVGSLAGYAAVLAAMAGAFAVLALASLRLFTTTKQETNMTDSTYTQTSTRDADPASGARKHATPDGCCGGPAPAGTDGCCAQDAKAKSTGGSGCGCGSTPAAPTVRKSACCG